MSKLRVYTFLSLFVLAVILMAISIYLNHKSEVLSSQIWSEFHQFTKENSVQFAGEGHLSDEDQKEVSRLFLQANNNKAIPTLKRYRNGTALSFLFSIVFIIAGSLVLTWGILKKIYYWIFNTPKRAIIILAISFFVGTWVFPPFNFKGHIYYSFFFNPIWNGSEIFWALLLVEWTVALLPLGLLYKRSISDKIVNIQQ